jgi:hypothetical protein
VYNVEWLGAENKEEKEKLSTVNERRNRLFSVFDNNDVTGSQGQM